MRRKRILTSTLFGVVLFAVSSITALAQSPSRDEILSDIKSKRAELQELENKFLAPSAEDQLAYAAFLQQPDTGLARLLPRETYDVDANKKNQALTVRGGGAFYSFTRQTHEYGWGTQIGFEQGSLMTCFAGADYGMLTNLGDVPIEAVTLEHGIVKSLASYERASDEPRARAEYQRFATGDRINGTLFKTRLPATLNNSYVLRGIHYSDSDVLVAFRIVRKDTDGSLIIVWKLLKKNPKPELARTN
jgi:hypothetical protein